MDDTTLTIPAPPSSNGQRVLPSVIEIDDREQHRIPSPGTQRALKAQTGQAWDQLVGPDADSADRIQTMIWIHLRKSIPDLRWDECDEVELQVNEGQGVPPNPLGMSASETSPHSVDSGG